MREQTQAPDAPAGFNTPSFKSYLSKSNGIPEPGEDTFAVDQDVFERNHDFQDGLGPTYNAVACISCHESPNSAGGASQTTELRVGHVKDGTFVNPTIPINGGQNTITGRSIVNDRAICPQAQEVIPATENLIELRAVLNTLGDGFVEAVPDQTLINIANGQPGLSGGKIKGEYIEVPISEGPAGTTRVGRFGWKDQHGSLLSFAADAFINEIGVTNRFHKTSFTTVCTNNSATNPPPPVDQRDNLGLFQIDHFAQFIRGTKAPPRDNTPGVLTSVPVVHGEAVFESIGCNICHVDTMVTAPAGTVLNGGKYTVSAAIGNKAFHPYGDFLLHDIGTAGGIVQTASYQDTAFKLRTAPLWGLRTRTRFMHDLQSLSLEDAIARHRGEASGPAQKFSQLSAADQQDLLDFLNSL